MTAFIEQVCLVYILFLSHGLVSNLRVNGCDGFPFTGEGFRKVEQKKGKYEVGSLEFKVNCSGTTTLAYLYNYNFMIGQKTGAKHWSQPYQISDQITCIVI